MFQPMPFQMPSRLIGTSALTKLSWSQSIGFGIRCRTFTSTWLIGPGPSLKR